MTTAVVGGQLLGQLGGTVAGLVGGISGRDASRDFADRINAAAVLDASEATRAFTKRRADTEAAFAAGGVDVTRGTPLTIRRESLFRAEEAAARIKWNAAMRAYRAEREGDATFMAGIAAASRSAAAFTRTLLDTPFGSESDIGVAPSLQFPAEISATPVTRGPSSDPFAIADNVWDSF